MVCAGLCFCRNDPNYDSDEERGVLLAANPTHTRLQAEVAAYKQEVCARQSQQQQCTRQLGVDETLCRSGRRNLHTDVMHGVGAACLIAWCRRAHFHCFLDVVSFRTDSCHVPASSVLLMCRA